MINTRSTSARVANAAGARDSEGLAQCIRLIDAVPFYVLLVDDQHRIVAYNRALREEFGLAEDPMGQCCSKLVHGVDGAYSGCPLEEAIASGHAIEKELYDETTGSWTESSIYPTTLKTPEGRPVYLHFTRDKTQEKEAAIALELSLEHHKALGELQQRLRDCHAPEETLDVLIDSTARLSWMNATCGAGAFLVRGGELQLVAQRNLDNGIAQRCSSVPLGECLCGKVAVERRRIVSGALDSGHSVARHPRSTQHGHATLPLVHEGRSLGVVNFYLAHDRELAAPQLAYLEAATGITAATLAEQLASQAAREARAKAAQLERNLLQRVLASQEEERKRVARELHDDLGQGLSALLLDVQSWSRSSPASQEFCDRTASAARELITRVSQLAWDLRPSILDDYGLDSALTRHIDNVAKRAELAIDYQFISADRAKERLPPSVEVVLYRVTQEALNNLVRHAEASHVSVIVIRNEDGVTLLVEDDGCGFSPDVDRQVGESGGLGLTGMRERLALLKGQLMIESTPGGGTSIRATIPLSLAD